MITPEHIEKIGAEIAIRWSDGREDYYPAPFLRRNSPSAETVGERDLLGQKYGGDHPGTDHSRTGVVGWQLVGNYAIQFRFTDGHNTGLFSFDLLRRLGDLLQAGDAG